MKKISLIIIAYNRPQDLVELLEDITKLADKELLEEVIILNNASTESFQDVVDFTQSNPETPFRYILSKENLGVSRGRNYASSFATGDLFFYLDDDVLIEDKYLLKKVIDSFSVTSGSSRPIGAVSFKVKYVSNRQMQLNAFPHKNFEELKDKMEFDTYYYTGCAHAILKEAWQNYGGYPLDFFYGMEEYDCSFWLINAGYKIKYYSLVEIFHKESPLGRKPHGIKLQMMWLNKSKVAWKYLPKKYFYSVAFMWSLEFLKQTGFKIFAFFKNWKRVAKIPATENRNPINQEGMQYMKQVRARLWY